MFRGLEGGVGRRYVDVLRSMRKLGYSAKVYVSKRGRRGKWNMGREHVLTMCCRTLVYLEGDATMRTYEDAEGKKQSALSVVQTKIEVLKRPQPSTEDAAEGGALGV